MTEELFWLRANSLKLRYKRSVLKAQRKHLKALQELQLPVPVYLRHLEVIRHG